MLLFQICFMLQIRILLLFQIGFVRARPTTWSGTNARMMTTSIRHLRSMRHISCIEISEPCADSHEHGPVLGFSGYARYVSGPGQHHLSRDHEIRRANQCRFDSMNRYAVDVLDRLQSWLHQCDDVHFKPMVRKRCSFLHHPRVMCAGIQQQHHEPLPVGHARIDIVVGDGSLHPEGCMCCVRYLDDGHSTVFHASPLASVRAPRVPWH